MSRSSKVPATFPEPPIAAAQRTLQSIKSRAQIHRVSILYQDAPGRNHVMLSRRGARPKVLQQEHLDHAFGGWPDAFRGLFSRARVTFLRVDFDEAPRLTLRAIPAWGTDVLAAVAETTRRLEFAAMAAAAAARAEGGSSLGMRSFILSFQDPRSAIQPNPSFSFHTPAAAVRTAGTAMTQAMERWWNDAEIWRRCLSGLQINAAFEIRSMHEAAAFRAEAATDGAGADS